jgi:hypothetical protein
VKNNSTPVLVLVFILLSITSLPCFSQDGCFPTPVAPVFTPASAAISQGQTVTFTVSNAVAGYSYQVEDALSGQPLSQTIGALSNGTLFITTDPFNAPGTFPIVIRSTSLLGSTQCTSVSSTGTVFVNPILLPLSLIQFKGRKQNVHILLEWKTAREDRLNRFEIERSMNGTTFEKTGEMHAAGTSNSEKRYSFTDFHPFNPVNYYRLKMIDNDGRFTYSNTLFFSGEDTGNDIPISITPNPFTEALNIQLSLDKAQPIDIQLVDMTGRAVTSKNVQCQQGSNAVLLNGLSSLPDGIYFIRVKTTEGIYQQRILKGR